MVDGTPQREPSVSVQGSSLHAVWSSNREPAAHPVRHVVRWCRRHSRLSAENDKAGRRHSVDRSMPVQRAESAPNHGKNPSLMPDLQITTSESAAASCKQCAALPCTAHEGCRRAARMRSNESSYRTGNEPLEVASKQRTLASRRPRAGGLKRAGQADGRTSPPRGMHPAHHLR